MRAVRPIRRRGWMALRSVVYVAAGLVMGCGGGARPAAAPSGSASPTSPTGAAAPAGADTAQVDVIEIKGEKTTLPEDFTFRARVTAMQPQEKMDLNWRYGGEAMGGDVYSGTLGKELAVNQWTESIPLISLAKVPVKPAGDAKDAKDAKEAAPKFEVKFPPAYQNRVWFITVTSGNKATKSMEVEFEFSYKGKVVKTFKEAAPNGPTLGIAIPHYRLAGKEPTDPQFLTELGGLLSYASRRADYIESLPWAKWPLPKKLMVVSDVSGYGENVSYGVRYSNKAVTEAETRTMHQMGANSLRSAPAFLLDMGRKHEGFGSFFGKGEVSHAMGFPIVGYRKGAGEPPPDAGCPFGPKVPELTAEAVKRSVEDNVKIPVDQVWALTVDEIGSVFDATPQGKTHMDTCPQCAEAFREYAKSLGATPKDFGQSDWKDVKPTYSRGPGAMSYYTRKFNNYASAHLFTEVMKAFDAENAKKKAAMAKGEKSGPATQPWMYTYALRGNTFLLGGHSLDFFDFYRVADNALVYETSNTGRQIWQWDSYLCDVGRVVGSSMNKQFGIYVKPHRGAPVQRALTAMSRGANMLYWYTYGPEYYKGDSFADNIEAVALASKGGHLIGKTEDLLVGSKWAVPAEVAVVKPRCSEFLGNNAQWENAKWVYTALAQAHIPVDPIDEIMVAQNDLSKYKVIYLNGSHLPRRSAEALAKWVQNGGILWTSGFGCARDEANEPLTALEPVLGLEGRSTPEMWYKITRYGAGAVQSFDDGDAVVKAGEDADAPLPKRGKGEAHLPFVSAVPAGAKIVGGGAYAASFMPAVGREILKPASGTKVLAKYADGSAAMTVHSYGKGKAYVVGFYPGLEYSATVRDGSPDMSKDFDASRLSFISVPALEVVKPVVAASVPAVEGVLLKNPSGKQAVTLMNWAYKPTQVRKYEGGKTETVYGIAELKDVKVTIRGAGNVKKVTSAMLDKDLSIKKDGDTITVVVPDLQEGDVLVLE